MASKCTTVALAYGIAASLVQCGHPARWASTFENSGLLRCIQNLATVHSSQTRIYLIMDDGTGHGCAYSLGTMGMGRARPMPIEFGELPVGTEGPGRGHELVITLTGLSASTATVGMESFRDGLRHGCARGSPAVVLVEEGAVDTAFYSDGIDVSDMVRNPASTVSDMLQRACFAPFLDAGDAAAVRAVSTAERNGAAIVLRSDAMPCTALCRRAGQAGIYEVIEVGEGTLLDNTHGVLRVATSWTPHGGPTSATAWVAPTKEPAQAPEPPGPR
jgi:hypothetical protein